MPDGSFSIDCAHIRPLGIPHSGKDEVANMLSLSPTMHRLFDRGCIRINPDTLAISLLYGNDIPHRTKLLVRGNHVIQKGNLSYHLSQIAR
jgi:putative restriction endonuclease